jgi:hypothetical protein
VHDAVLQIDRIQWGQILGGTCVEDLAAVNRCPEIGSLGRLPERLRAAFNVS